MKFAKTLLIKSKREEYRIEQVGVFGKSGLTYMAIEPEFVKQEMKNILPRYRRVDIFNSK
ncbi:MAG TPA: hypothetical protein PKW37_05895 [Salinivirgaceae bacterium]|nr:hypothetical protein [Salinivirgaceae bacterium]